MMEETNVAPSVYVTETFPPYETSTVSVTVQSTVFFTGEYSNESPNCILFSLRLLQTETVKTNNDEKSRKK